MCEATGASSPTVGRVLANFEERRWLVRDGPTYGLTPLGEYVATIRTVTETGRPAAAIVNYAEENDFDHIVLGSHGRSGLSRFLLGSVAESVAERAHRSVTIIRENDTNHE